MTNPSDGDWRAFTHDSYKGKALPFIVLDETTGRYTIGEEAKEFLSLLPHGFGAVAIVGKYRTGKSFFLNRCLLDAHKGSGFGVGPTVQACTKGLWLHTKLLMSPQGYPLLVVDTEGIGSLDADNTHDTRIFALALLLSSYFIYNSVGTIDEAALQNLSLVLNISREIHLHSEQDANTHPDDLARYFPQFLWVLRDFVLSLEDADGNVMDSRTYLENALAPNTIKQNDRDDVRRLIRHYFSDRNCRTLVRPVTDENDLRHLDTKPNKSLRREFVRDMESVRDLIVSSAPHKQVNAGRISGTIYIALCESIIQSINDGHAPAVADTWNMIKDIQSREKEDEILCQWERDSQWVFQTPPKLIDPIHLQHLFSTNMERALSTLEDRPPSNIRERLVDKLNAKISSVTKINDTNIDAYLTQGLRVVDAASRNMRSLDELKKTLDDVECKMMQRLDLTSKTTSVIMGRWKVMMGEAMWGWMGILLGTLETALEKCMGDQKAQQSLMQTCEEDLKDRQTEIDRLGQEVDALEEKLVEHRNTLEQQIDAAVRPLRDELGEWEARWDQNEEERGGAHEEALRTIAEMTVQAQANVRDMEVRDLELQDKCELIDRLRRENEEAMSAPQEDELLTCVLQAKVDDLILEIKDLKGDNDDLNDRLNKRESQFREQLSTLTQETATAIDEQRQKGASLERELQQLQEASKVALTQRDKTEIHLKQSIALLEDRLKNFHTRASEADSKMRDLVAKTREDKEAWMRVLSEQQANARETLATTASDNKAEVQRIRATLDSHRAEHERQVVDLTSQLGVAKTENVRLGTQLEHKRKRLDNMSERGDRKRIKQSNQRLTSDLIKAQAREEFMAKEIQHHSSKSKARLEEVRVLNKRVHVLEQELAVARLRVTMGGH